MSGDPFPSALERQARRTIGQYDMLRPGDEVSVCLRMERTRILRAPEGPCALPATLRSRHYAGGAIREIAVLASGQEVVALSQTAGEDRIPQGEQAFVCWNPREAALVR